MARCLIHLIVHLIDPFITESHYTYRNFYRSKIRNKSRQSRCRTNLKAMGTLIISGQIITCTIGVFSLPVSISQTNFIEEPWFRPTFSSVSA